MSLSFSLFHFSLSLSFFSLFPFFQKGEKLKEKKKTTFTFLLFLYFFLFLLLKFFFFAHNVYTREELMHAVVLQQQLCRDAVYLSSPCTHRRTFVRLYGESRFEKGLSRKEERKKKALTQRNVLLFFIFQFLSFSLSFVHSVSLSLSLVLSSLFLSLILSSFSFFLSLKRRRRREMKTAAILLIPPIRQRFIM